MSGKVLSEAEIRAMDARIERVFDDVAAGRPETGVAGEADPYDVRERKKDVLKGRDLDKEGHWKKVMEAWGFNWIPAEALNASIGPRRYIPSTLSPLAGERLHDRYGRGVANTSLYWTRPHEEGQWRSDLGANRPPKLLTVTGPMGFTMVDLIDLFQKPEEFDRWARAEIVKRRKARMGLGRSRPAR